MKLNYKKIPIQLKVSFWCAFCIVFQKGIAFLTTPIFTRILSVEEFGTYSLFTTWLSIITIISTLELAGGVYNRGLIKYKNDVNGFTSSLLGLGSVFTFTFFIIYLLFQSFFNNLFSLPTEFVVCIFAQCLVTPAISFWTLDNRFKNKYVASTIVTVVMTLLIPLIGIVLALNFENRLLMKILSFTIIQCCICGFIYIMYFVKGKKFFNKEYWSYALKFNVPLIPYFLSQIILSHSDKLTIEYFFGEGKVGIYSLCFTIGSLLIIISSSINASFVPWTYRKLEQSDFKSVQNKTNFLLMLFVVPMFLLLLIAPEIVLIMGTSVYAEGIWIIPPIIVSALLIFIGNLYSNVEFYYEKTNYVMMFSILTAAINIILNLIFVPLYGYIAAAYTTLFSYSVQVILHYFSVMMIRKKLKIRTDIYNNKIIFLVILASLTFMFICLLLYSNIITRYISVAVIILIIICFFKRILLFLKSIIKNN